MNTDMFEIKDLEIVSDQAHDEVKEKAEKIDYKMVTFSLGGKDYGIDIMKVKEISKASKFTYVPNSIPFVKGVYNLRGDIISVIDMRLMFNLPVPQSKGEPENMIILRLDDNVLGIIVDSIDKVVGISSSDIQPPHPLFGDINIRFIKGIVENDNKLYIILDVESVFDQDSANVGMHQTASYVQHAKPAVAQESVRASRKGLEDVNYGFVLETLATFGGFSVTPVNEDWVISRYKTWAEQRTNEGADIQLKNSRDAEDFLSGFLSPYSGLFWEQDLADRFKEILPDLSGGLVGVWNIGCGKGEETYSAACALKQRYPEKRIKIYANDKDLLNISTAPNLVFTRNLVPEIYDPFIQEGRNGWHFSSDIKDLILFEYHDVANDNQFPPVDFIIARDVLSFLPADKQQMVMNQFEEKLKTGGILIVGANERITASGWTPVQKNGITVYKKQ